MVERILVPLDGSEAAEQALAHARAVARAFDAGLCLVRVTEPGRTGGVGHDAVAWRLDRSDARSYVDRLASELRASGLEVEVEVPEGRAAEEILRLVREREADLVVLTSHGRRPGSDFPLGGTAEKVVAGAGVSVLVVRPERGPGAGDREVAYERLMVPVDGSHRADWAASLAAAVAGSHGAELLLVHVAAEPEVARRLPLDPDLRELRREIQERNREAARECLSELQHRLDSSEVRTRCRTVTGQHVAGTLHRMAREMRADLIVASAHGASGVAPWPYGSVAANLLRYSPTPLLVLQDQPETGAGRRREPFASRLPTPVPASSERPARQERQEATG